MPICKYLNEEKMVCNLASEMAYGTLARVTSQACEVCKKSSSPMSENNVTASLAISACRNTNKYKDIRDKLYHLLLKEDTTKVNIKRLELIINGIGVGSQLWKLLESIEIKHQPTCPCLDWAERMNSWGPEICKQNRQQIVDHMKSSAKSYGWGDLAKATIKVIVSGLAFKVNPLDIYGSLLDEAIRLAEVAEIAETEKKNLT